MSHVTILTAGTEHLGALTPLFDAYRVSYGQPSDLAQARKFLCERLGNLQSTAFLAIRDGSPVGFVQLYPSFSSVSCRRLWILNDLFVDQAARHTGIGTALLERCRRFARETGAVRLVLSTAIDNSIARTAYEKHGWKLDEQFVHYDLAIESDE